MGRAAGWIHGIQFLAGERNINYVVAHRMVLGRLSLPSDEYQGHSMGKGVEQLGPHADH